MLVLFFILSFVLLNFVVASSRKSVLFLAFNDFIQTLVVVKSFNFINSFDGVDDVALPQ